MARIVLCLNCNLGWQISKMQKVPLSGYECPYCFSKRKRALRSGNSSKAQRKTSYVDYITNI